VPINPSSRIRAIDRDENSPLVVLIVRPNAVDRVAPERIPINETTGIGHILRIFLDDFPLKNAEEDLIERETVCLGFLVRMICNTYSVAAYRVNDIFNTHSR
jgi:hypothetical protein